MTKKTTLLCILDGFGLNPETKGNAVQLAKKPTLDELMKSSPSATLVTYGEAVGLPVGQMGNSEVGHLNIGAGRVVEQWLLRIGRALSGTFLDTSEVYTSFVRVNAAAKRVHVTGLYSTGGVHSHAEHLKLLIKRLVRDLPNAEILLHLISDGRDVSPNAFKDDLSALLSEISVYPQVSVASLCGRFFAMDRDKRWERVEAAYNAIALGEGALVSNPVEYVRDSYTRGITDEFLEPAVTSHRAIEASDAVVFFNFREDRMREIVTALCRSDFSEFQRRGNVPNAKQVLCFTEYDHSLHLPYLFAQLDIHNHLGEVIAKAGLRQLRVAETEKYPHVTYFMNGGIEKPYEGEDRELRASPRDVKTYDLKPEMSAFAVAEAVIEGIRSGTYDLIVVNFANCDMVGHTGVVDAGVKAVETVDTCLGNVLSALRDAGGQALIIADHGNAEQMVNYEDGSPHTAHTTYPVPVILVNYPEKVSLRDGGALCDVAPTILKMMGVPKPAEMTGEALF